MRMGHELSRHVDAGVPAPRDRASGIGPGRRRGMRAKEGMRGATPAARCVPDLAICATGGVGVSGLIAGPCRSAKRIVSRVAARAHSALSRRSARPSIVGASWMRSSATPTATCQIRPSSEVSCGSMSTGQDERFPQDRVCRASLPAAPGATRATRATRARATLQRRSALANVTRGSRPTYAQARSEWRQTRRRRRVPGTCACTQARASGCRARSLAVASWLG